MKIIPAINCKDFVCATQKFDQCFSFLPFGEMVHVDISDGTFTSYITWNNPDELRTLIHNLDGRLKVGVHLMMDSPEDSLEAWLVTGAKRAVVHAECISDPDYIKNTCFDYGVEPVLAIAPSTQTEDLLAFSDYFMDFLVLAVEPGGSGQIFQALAIEKIKAIEEMLPDAVIEVDGGINPETLKMVRAAGAEQAIVGSYIFDSKNPKLAYDELYNVKY